MLRNRTLFQKIFVIAICVISIYVFIFISEMDWIWTIGVCLMPIFDIITSIKEILCDLKNEGSKNRIYSEDKKYQG